MLYSNLSLLYISHRDTVGSTFQLVSGSPPPLGAPATFGIVFVGFPACFYLLYAAILKGIAETEEDDKKFLRGE